MKLIGLLFASFLLSAQTADVTVLHPSESYEAKEAYGQLKAAEKHWADIQERIKRKYGIQHEIEFSKDFVAVVPKPQIISVIGWGSGNSFGPCPTWNPVFKDATEHKNGSNFVLESR
jgi:hypothetical protein